MGRRRRAKGEGRRAKREGRRAKGEGRRAKGEGRRANEDGEGGFGLEFEGLEVTVTRLDAGEGVCRPVVLDDEVLDAGQAAPSEERLPVHPARAAVAHLGLPRAAGGVP